MILQCRLTLALDSIIKVSQSHIIGMGRIRVSGGIPAIEVNEKGKSRIVLELVAQKDEIVGSIEPVIFKIKCNLKQCIELIPVYGFLLDDPKGQKKTIEIKYFGDRSQMEALKLQICWIEASQWLSQQLSRDQYPIIYKKCLQESKTGEKSLILPFQSLPDQPGIPYTKQQAQEAVRPEVKEFRFESAINPYERQRLETISKKVSEKKKHIQPEVNSNIENHKLKKEQSQESLAWTIYQLTCFIVFVYLLGITVGIRLQRLQQSQSHPFQ